jgi:hypothetical protein
MAEATNRPPETTSAASEQRVATHSEQAASPEAAGATLAPATETYHPLSLLALVGFVLAIAYALLVLVGGLVALLGRVPWLLPLWTFAVPLAVLLVCWVARNRIRDSEGVLTGLVFTTWGMRLTVIVALTYLAYYTFAFFAVRLQASDYVERIFDQLKQRNVEQAFLLAMGQPSSDDSAEMRRMIEARFNTSPGARPGQSGPFSRFRQSQFVRYMLMADGQVKITPLGVVEWGYERGGYRVVLKYQIATPLAEFELTVDTVGLDSKPGEQKGRQWSVDFSRGAMSIDRRSEKMTASGKDLLVVKSESAFRFVSAWVDRFNNRQWNEAYLETLPPSERRELSLAGAVPAAGLTPLGFCPSSARTFLAGKQTLADRHLLNLNEKVFWASSKSIDDIRRRVRQTFPAPGEGRPASAYLQISRQVAPILREENGQLTYKFDVEIRYMAESSEHMDYLVEGQLVVRADSNETSRPNAAWWVERIDLDSGRMPSMMKMEGAPVRGGGRPAPPP